MKFLLVFLLLSLSAIVSCDLCDDPPTGCHKEFSSGNDIQYLYIEGCCSSGTKKISIWERERSCDKENGNMCSWSCWSEDDSWKENC